LRRGASDYRHAAAGGQRKTGWPPRSVSRRVVACPERSQGAPAAPGLTPALSLRSRAGVEARRERSGQKCHGASR
jgi:hypothetical protein